MEARKSLTWIDLLMMNIVAVTSLRWIASAASNGPSSLVLWALATLLFFVPEGIAVSRLSETFPEDAGGLYRWTQRAAGPFHGFLCGWCYWVNNLLYFPGLLLYVSGNVVFALDAAHPEWHLASSSRFAFLLTLGCLWAIAGFTLLGMRVGKWVQNAGAIGNWIPGLLVAVLGALAYRLYGSANTFSLATLTPHVKDYSQLSFFAQMCFALAGLELVSFVGSEVQGPRRAMTKSLLVSAFVIVGIYWVGTLGVLASVPQEKINLMNGLLIPLQEMGARWHLSWLGPVGAFFIALGGIGSTMAWFAGASRVPYMVGVDRYLPASFGRLHPRLGTPYVAILTQTAAATFFTILATAGASTGMEAVYKILVDMCLVLYFIPYCYLFHALIRLGDGRRYTVAGYVGLVTTLVAIVTTLFPEAGTVPWLSLAKTIGGTFAMLAVGALLYLRGQQRRKLSVESGASIVAG